MPDLDWRKSNHTSWTGADLHRLRSLLCAVIAVVVVTVSRAQDPSLFLSKADFQTRLQLAQREPWAKQSLTTLLQEADSFPGTYMARFGLHDAAPPPEGGQWLHWYACPETGTPLRFEPPDRNICPDTGKNFIGHPYDHVVYQMRNDALAEAAVSLGLAYRFTSKQMYAQKAVDILLAYTRVYPTYVLHDNSGKPGVNGAKAYSQTLDESLWLIKIAWTYDLVRGAGLMNRQQSEVFERDVLRVSAATVVKAHKEPTWNIQSWINGALAAVGYVLQDQTFVTEAIDGPIGFRHQMKTFVHEGFWEEGAWGYQFYAMRPLTMLAQMARRHGTDLWQQESQLLSLYHGPLGVVLPDGSLPAFNDGGAADLYSKDYLYEVAYAETHDASLLAVLNRGSRNSREALLFGVEQLPPASANLRQASEVFPQAGYAALRSPTSDLTAVVKFGPHGGAHGHYDKLNFVFFAHGTTLAIDPGSQLYGLPIHRDWDSKTVAHNTISVDQERQAAATGSLLGWKAGEGWTAVRLDGGKVYPQARLQRTMLLTPEYLLIVDECEALDHKPHLFDWAYHNAGNEALLSSLRLEPETGLPQQNGYGRLAQPMHGSTGSDIAVRFVSQPAGKHPGHSSNSTAETVRSQSTALQAAGRIPDRVQVDLEMPGAPGTDIVLGHAPGPNLHVPVPFLLVRRKGQQASFVAVLTPTVASQTAAAQASIKVHTLASGAYSISSANFVDTFDAREAFSYHRAKR